MRPRLLLSFALALTLAVGAGAAPALAQDGDLMSKARAEMAQLNYDAAIALLEQAEATGKNQPVAMVEIYRATAEAHAAMGRADAAETSFRRLLALDPSVELPAGSSPKLMAPFTGAREFLAGRRIAVECRRGAADAATLVVQSDPVDLVAGARLTTQAGESIGADARGQARIALSIPGGAAAAGCAALDRHGNLLVRAELSATAEDAAPAGGGGEPSGGGDVVGSAPAERGERPIYARWWPYAIVAGAAGGVAIFYGLKVSQAEDDLEELHQDTMQADHDITYADALEIEDRGQGYARNANVALVVTGVFAAVSGGLLIHQLVTDGRRGEEEQPAARSERSPRERDARSNRMTPLGGPSKKTPWAFSAGPLPGGGSVNLTLGF